MGTNVFLDILNANPEFNVYDFLREEAAQAFQSEANWSDPKALHKLVLADSAIRESLRTNPISARGLMREVTPKDGLVLPDGKRVARGTWDGSQVQRIHMDDRFYDRPDQYDRFRSERFTSNKDRRMLRRLATRFSGGATVVLHGQWRAFPLQPALGSSTNSL